MKENNDKASGLKKSLERYKQFIGHASQKKVLFSNMIDVFLATYKKSPKKPNLPNHLKLQDRIVSKMLVLAY